MSTFTIQKSRNYYLYQPILFCIVGIALLAAGASGWFEDYTLGILGIIPLGDVQWWLYGSGAFLLTVFSIFIVRYFLKPNLLEFNDEFLNFTGNKIPLSSIKKIFIGRNDDNQPSLICHFERDMTMRQISASLETIEYSVNKNKILEDIKYYLQENGVTEVQFTDKT
jgi:hypothetical protein